MLPDFPISLINYVARTKEKVTFNQAEFEKLFANDPYIVVTQPKSVYCLPLTHQEQFIGILYLENRITAGAFSDRCLTAIELLTAQATMCLARNIWNVALVK